MSQENEMVRDFTEAIIWYHGKQTNPGGKLFSNDDLDENKKIYEGLVEDQSSAQGPTNFNTHVSPMIGRGFMTYNLIHKILCKDMKIHHVYGEKGVGKTRHVKEVAQFLNERSFCIDGAYYLDFSEVYEQAHLNKIFTEAGIEFLLKKNNEDMSINRLIKPTETAEKDLDILLIYDSIDKIVLNSSLFDWHLRQVLGKNPKINIIMTTKNRSELLEKRSDISMTHVIPLTFADSVKLVENFSLGMHSDSSLTMAERL